MEDGLIHALVFLGVGIGAFFHGFNRLRRKRLIENLPTSTVRGMAMGLVELNGSAQKSVCLTAPLTQRPCVFYRYLVEREQKSKDSTHWVKVAGGDSSYCPFWLQDATGKAMVIPRRAEVILPVDFTFSTGLGTTLPDTLHAFLQGQGIRYGGLFGGSRLRFREWRIEEGEEVYVLGTAQKSHDAAEGHKHKLIERLEKLKDSRDAMAAVDLNTDGVVSEEEWAQAVAGVEQKLLEEEASAFRPDEAGDVYVGWGDVQKVFIISDRKQSELVRSLGWGAFFAIAGGALLAAGMFCWLVYQIIGGR